MIDLSTIDARKLLVGKYATKYGLDTALVCALIEQESAWSQYAARYEPAFFSRYIQPLVTARQITNATEASLRATSIGLMQTMGEVVREYGFTGHLLQLTDPDTSLDWGCRKLKSCFDTANGDARNALLHWNGGADVAYPDEVLARVAKYA
jgi:soluble lytic murein transglycosylase-like protein